MSTHEDTEEEKSLISFAQSHPVAKRLLSLSDTILLREIYAIPKIIPRLNTTAGVLRGPTLLRTSPFVLVHSPGKIVFGAFSMGPDLAGYPGIAHGGLIAMLLDEVMGKAGKTVFEDAFTAKMEVDYLRPVLVDSFVAIIARVRSTEGRKVWITATVEGIANGVTCANASMLLVKLKNSKI